MVMGVLTLVLMMDSNSFAFYTNNTNNTNTTNIIIIILIIPISHRVRWRERLRRREPVERRNGS